MSRVSRYLIVVSSTFALVAFLAPRLPGQAEQHQLNAAADALPDGALARHGTVRLRHRGEISSLAFTPDGKSLLSFGNDQTYRKWEVATGKEQWRYEKKGQMFVSQNMPAFRDDLRFANQGWGGGQRIMFRRGNNYYEGGAASYVRLSHNADGALLAVFDANDAAVILNAASDKQILKMSHKGQGCTICLSPDGKLLAIAELINGEESVVRVWDIGRDKELSAMTVGQARLVTKLAFSDDNSQLAGIVWQANNNFSQVRMWDVATGKRTRLYDHDAAPIGDIAFAHDGRFLASAGADGTIRIWETASEEEVKRFGKSGAAMFLALAFAHDGSSVAASSGEGDLHVCDMATGQDKVFQGHGGRVMAVAVSPDGATIASACDRGVIRLWDAATGKERPAVKHAEQLNGLGLLDGGRTLALWTAGDQIRQIDALSGGERRKTKGPGTEFTLLKISPNGQVAAVMREHDTSVTLWSIPKGAELRKLPGQGDEQRMQSVAFSADSASVITSCIDGSVQVWNVDSGKQTLRIARGAGLTTAFSPDGKLLAISTNMAEISLLEVLTGKERCRLRTPPHNEADTLAFSPDSRLLAWAGDDSVRLWDVVKGKVLRSFLGHQGAVTTIAFSPCDGMLATGSADGTVRLWKTDTAEELRCFDGHLGTVQQLAFSYDGKTLISAGTDQCIYVWDAASRTAVQPGETVAKKLDRCWADLASPDAKVAFQAMGGIGRAAQGNGSLPGRETAARADCCRRGHWQNGR